MENQLEKGPERIPTKEEVMELISKHTEFREKFETLRELSDESGLTLLDLRFEGKEHGETTEYLYTRKGLLPNGMETKETSIEISYYQYGNPVGGDRLAILNDETGEWQQ